MGSFPVRRAPKRPGATRVLSWNTRTVSVNAQAAQMVLIAEPLTSERHPIRSA